MFITKENGIILSWTICLFNDKHIVGLYSFTDRNHTNRGGQQYAKFMIYNWARERGFTTYDTMWGAPTGFPEHELASVSAFKESMGGYKMDYIGNFDIILNKPIYKLLKRYYLKRN
jgi:lipid II:glycine glycyltransferase (peptidoglycan interpeptide bridge formation enzyme)